MVLGALIGTVLSCIIGALWYHPAFLGTPWMRGAHPGKTPKQIGDSSSHAMYITVLSCGTMSLLLHFIILNVLNIQSLVEAASVGAGLGCLVLLADISHCAFGFRSFTSFLIDHVYDIVILAITAVCIVYFNKYGFNLDLNIGDLKDSVLKKTGL